MDKDRFRREQNRVKYEDHFERNVWIMLGFFIVVTIIILIKEYVYTPSIP